MSGHHNNTNLPPERDEKAFNLMQTIKRRFFAMRNGALADQMRQGGLNYRINFGLLLPQIKEIASELLVGGHASQELADLSTELWDNVNTRESRLLAPMIYPTDLMTENRARQWMIEAQTTEVADILCHSLLRHLPYALHLAMSLLPNPTEPHHCATPEPHNSVTPTELQQYTVLRLLLNLLASGKADATVIKGKIADMPCEASATLTRLRAQILTY